MPHPRSSPPDVAELVAEACSAVVVATGSRDAARLTCGEKRIALTIEPLERVGPASAALEKPRLRFERVVVRLHHELEKAAHRIVPDGTTALVSVSAPIRLPAKTAVELTERLEVIVGKPRRPIAETLCGNDVRIELLERGATSAPKLAFFVHDPQTPSAQLFDLARSMLDAVERVRKNPAARNVDEFWLALTTAEHENVLPAYRAICTQLPSIAAFARVLVVFGDARVATLHSDRLQGVATATTSDLADRVRHVLAGRDVVEKKMMGGMCFMLDGHLCCGINKKGLLIRVGREGYERALARRHVAPMEFGGRRPAGYVVLEPQAYRTEAALRMWLGYAMSYVASLLARPPTVRKSSL